MKGKTSGSSKGSGFLFYSLFGAILGILMLGGLGWLFLSQVYFPEAQKDRLEKEQKQTGELLVSQLQNHIDRTLAHVTGIGRDNALFVEGFKALKSTKSPARREQVAHDLGKETEKLMKQFVPYVISVKVLPWATSGSAGLKKYNIELNNNIELLLYSRVANNKVAQPEIYPVNDKWRITFAAPVFGGETMLGVLLVSLNMHFFDTLFQLPAKDGIRVTLLNSQGKLIYPAGEKKNRGGKLFDTALSETLLDIYVKESLPVISADPVYHLLFLLTGAGILLFLGWCFLARRQLGEDVSLLLQYIHSLSAVHSSQVPQLKLSPLQQVIHQLTQLEGGIQKNAVNASTRETSDVSSKADESSAPPVGVPPEIFRDYDIRGDAYHQLTTDLGYAIGRAIGAEAVALSQTTLVTGGDCRLTTDALKAALNRGLLDSGCHVIDIGIVPTPLLYFATLHLKTRAGVMVTASHNPLNDNGFKIVLDGKSLAGEQIQKLRQRVQKKRFEEGEGQIEVCDTVSAAYLARLKGDIILAKPLKVVLDAGNGMGGPLGIEVLQALDCEVIPLYCDPDGHFPNHSPDPCNPSNLKTLIQKVRSEQADVGIALDGDADRLVAVTGSGQVLSGDELMMLFASDIVAQNPGGSIVYDVKCSSRLTSSITEAGGRPVMWKTGHSHIKNRMKEMNALLGGEYTGHFCFNDRWFGFDDGIYAAARLIELLSMGYESLDEKLSALPSVFSTRELSLGISRDKDKFLIMKKLDHLLKDIDAERVDIDGLRLEFADGWGLVRASNTESKLTLRFEARSEEALSRIMATFRSALSEVNPQLVLPIPESEIVT